MRSQRRLVSPAIEANLPNTFIGGAASIITNKALLADRLGISENDIIYFGINGSDVEARIERDYNLPNTVFRNRTNFFPYNILTFFYDYDNHIKHIGVGVFESQTNFFDFKLEGVNSIYHYPFYNNIWTKAIFPNLIDIVGVSVFDKVTTAELLYFPVLEEITNSGNTFGYAKNVYMPQCIQIAGTSGNEGAFSNSPQNVKIWAHPSLQTSNNGAEEGDLAWARANKAAIIDYSQPVLTPNDFGI